MAKIILLNSSLTFSYSIVLLFEKEITKHFPNGVTLRFYRDTNAKIYFSYKSKKVLSNHRF